ncbi:FKBP-type peptidyl-prolyl cis-trans isomerase [Saccharomonospora sp. NPDC006951]
MRNAGKIMIVAAFATALTACSPSNEEPTDLPPGEQPVHTPAPASVSESAAPSNGQGEQAGQCTAEDITVDLSGQDPRVTIPRDCAAPSSVLTEDLEAGSGDAATTGNTVQIDYQVVGWSDGQVAESTFQQGQPLSVQLGQQQEIEGLTEGLTDIMDGGVRLIVLPPDLGYSAQSGNALADDTVVIVAEAVSVTTS